jgi:Mg/Co/Ni transporter MgtE
MMAVAIVAVHSDCAFAQVYGDGLQTKVNGLTHNIINFLLPAAAILGLVYASILAATGDTEAKSRMVLVVIASIVGFLAPLLIHWLQSVAG